MSGIVGSPCRAGECRSSVRTAHRTRECLWRLSSLENEWGTDRGCRVEMWRGGFRLGLSVTGPFGCRCLTSFAMLRFHIPLIKPDLWIKLLI
jgi:hypothetical protein